MDINGDDVTTGDNVIRAAKGIRNTTMVMKTTVYPMSLW
jgi:hypothetical protein